VRLLPKEPVTLRDTTGQDRVIDRPNPWRRHRTLAVALAVAAAGLGVLTVYLTKYSGAGISVSRERLSIATVERGSFVRDVAADGQVVAAVSPTLYANVAGTVTLKVHAGDTVIKGQELATIDSPDLTAKLSQEDATLQGLSIDWRRARLDAEHRLLQLRDAYTEAQVDQKTAQRELDRSRKAYELGAYSELQTLRAEDSLEKAKFAFAQAKMNYESQPTLNRFDVDSKKALLDRQQFMVTDLKRQVEALSVRSPVDGQIGQVQVPDRASVAKDAPLLTVVDLSALEVEIKIPESMAHDLRPGMKSDLEGDGRHWQGTVSAISPEVVNGQITTRLRFGDDKPAGLRQSQRLAVRILIDRRDNVLMVDRGSFLDQEGGGFAYLVHDNVAERHPVSLGAASIVKVEILQGLGEGDRIVINGTDAFNNAERVILTH
jgi:HlyD family secretion protein